MMHRRQLSRKRNSAFFDSAQTPRDSFSRPGPHPSPQRPLTPSPTNRLKFKTELCRSYEEQQDCQFGEACTFAHGLEELRAVPRHPKYKTELCKTYHNTGYCMYGARCHFVHNLQRDADLRRQFECEGLLPQLEAHLPALAREVSESLDIPVTSNLLVNLRWLYTLQLQDEEEEEDRGEHSRNLLGELRQTTRPSLSPGSLGGCGSSVYSDGCGPDLSDLESEGAPRDARPCDFAFLSSSILPGLSLSGESVDSSYLTKDSGIVGDDDVDFSRIIKTLLINKDIVTGSCGQNGVTRMSFTSPPSQVAFPSSKDGDWHHWATPVICSGIRESRAQSVLGHCAECQNFI